MIRPLLCLPIALLSLGPALGQERSLEARVKDLHALAGGEYCAPTGGFVPEDAYLAWTFSYQPSWSEDEADAEEITLIRVFCGAGAYNVQHAYYWTREYEGLTPLAFATPTFEAVYENDDIDAGLENLSVTGVTGATTLTNSEFDPDTLTITSSAFWRGIGDASSNGRWVFEDGDFTLKHFAIDASYDGEVNPEVVVDYP